MSSSTAELSQLVNRAGVVFSSTGGQLGHGRSKQSVSKQTVGQLLLELDELCNQRGERCLEEKSVEAIRLRVDMRTIVENLDLKRGIMTKDEIKEFTRVKQRILRGSIAPGTEQRDNLGTFDDAISGAWKPRPQQRLTAKHAGMLESIREEEHTQMQIVQELDEGTIELGFLARKLKDEVDGQVRVLNDATSKTNFALSRVENVRDRTSSLLDKINSKQCNCCAYIACVIVLMALGVVWNNLITKR